MYTLNDLEKEINQAVGAVIAQRKNLEYSRSEILDKRVRSLEAAIKGILKIIENEPEYPTPWPEDQVERIKNSGADPQLIAQTIVSLTKESILNRIKELLNGLG